MQLSPRQIQLILDALNAPESLQEFEALAEDQSRQEWVEQEDQPMDSANLRWRTLNLELGQARLDQLDPESVQLPPGLLTVADFYFYSGERSPSRPQLYGLELPVKAYRVWQTVFFYSPREACWQARPWLGVAQDPLLRLPYASEQSQQLAELAEIEESQLWEALCRAGDLMAVVRERVTKERLHMGGDRFRFPDIADIQEALEADDLGLTTCGLESTPSQMCLQLWRLNTNLTLEGPIKRPEGPLLAQGKYSGPLTEARSPSPASQKRMVLESLAEIEESLWRLSHPLEEEELDQLEEQRQQWVQRLEIAEPSARQS